MQYKIFKLLLFLILNLFLISSIQAIDCEVNDCFHEIGMDINVDIDLEIFLNTDIPLNENTLAVIAQIGSENEAYQYQYGVSDIALIYQEGFSNYAYQEQQGSYNQAYILQKGSENEAYQYQYSNDNIAIIIQMGNFNYAYQEQGIGGGSGYKSIIIQEGDGLRATVSQY